MRVLVHPADDGACGHYRLTWPARALIYNGEDVVLGDPSVPSKHWSDDMKIFGIFEEDWDTKEVRVLGLDRVPECDVFVMQRPLDAHKADMLMHMRKTNIATVVELDDDFTAIHPQNVSFWATHPAVHPQRGWHHMRRALEYADLITVSTPALQKTYARYTKTPIEVIPNYVPRHYFTTRKRNLERPYGDHKKLLLGWSGSVETHPVDLQQTRGAVASVLRENPHVKFTIVGTGRGVARALGTKADGSVLTTGWVPLKEYPEMMMELDVGIVPLQLSQFNEGKSWLKGLEWASLGVPFVASPTQQYRALNYIGAGMIAEKPSRWKFMLNMLVNSEDLRHEVAERGKVAASALVIEDHLEEWMTAWQLAAALKAASSH